MGFIVTFAEPFYTGLAASVSTNVLGTNQVAIGGHVYSLDTLARTWTHRSIPRLRPQQDAEGETSERSLNPEQLWRRSGETWHHGAGQTYLDKPESDPARFESSKGINVWDRWMMGLLPDTFQKKSSANTGLLLASGGTYLFVADGGEVYRTTSLTGVIVWTSTAIFAGEGTGTVHSITSNGYELWAALGSNGIHRVIAPAAATHWSDLQATLVSYVNGRLMAASGPSIYEVTAAGAAPAALMTHANPDFTWVGFAGSRQHIHAAGYSGDKSLIYKTTIFSAADGLSSEMTFPVVAGELPDGEIVRSIGSYLGFLLIGTDQGLRFAEVSADGDLTIGPLIETPNPVRCFEGQERFVWYGLTNYDSESSGLGRLDLTEFTSPLAPAYASDLMVTGQGTVGSVATFDGLRVFTVDTKGVYAETSDLVASGTLRTGRLSYGLSEPKIAQLLDIRFDTLAGSLTAFISRDSITFSSIGTYSTSTSLEELSAGQLTGDYFNLEFHLDRDGADEETGPIVSRYTLKSEVVVTLGDNLLVPLIFASVLSVDGADYPQKPDEELAYIRGLNQSRSQVIYQEGATSYAVTVDDYEFTPLKFSADKPYVPEGTCLVKLKVLG